MIELINGDCMDYMRGLPDKCFDLAIVDPPYGIDINKSGRLVKEKNREYKQWDLSIPDDAYFIELSRISKNQIIWGGNYFTLRPSRGYVIWDKNQPEGLSFAMCEYAWLSFDTSAKIFRYSVAKHTNEETKIHPTQKPVKLYEWLLINYAEKGQRILDTHLGSGSSAIASDILGFDFVGIELDKDYFEAAKLRLENHQRQLKIF